MLVRLEVNPQRPSDCSLILRSVLSQKQLSLYTVCWLKIFVKTMPDNLFDSLMISTHCISQRPPGERSTSSFIQYIFIVQCFMLGVGLNGKDRTVTKTGNTPVLTKYTSQQQSKDLNHTTISILLEILYVSTRKAAKHRPFALKSRQNWAYFQVKWYTFFSDSLF